MTCRDVLEFLSDYLTDELPPAVRARFARHLDACASCRAYLDSYEKTMALARSAGHEEEAPQPPRELEAAILAALRRRTDRTS